MKITEADVIWTPGAGVRDRLSSWQRTLGER
jgi:hypothetical protein